ncbi:hypothetical protein, partial [Segatella baroniae]|uniref:hypothetical protein n=1 Tax=Segatella baroniae TaxID=305719 RepID=UPI0028E70E0B
LFSSKSQLVIELAIRSCCCCRYCKGSCFQANHNQSVGSRSRPCVVADTAKVVVFTQITTDVRVYFHEDDLSNVVGILIVF